MEAITCIVGILLLAALLWVFKIIGEDSEQMNEGHDRALENRQKRNRAIEKLGAWLDRN